MKSPRHPRLLRAAIIAVLVTLTGGAVAAPAQAAAYRYWGYFHLTKGAWTFAQTGPAQAVPVEGSVEGWRFAVADEASVRLPRTTLTFAKLCGSTAVTAGSKRVGLVIDYGRPADSADGATPPAAKATCVSVPVKATGSDILVAAGSTLRIDKALSCAIDGWPATGCGEPVAKVSAAAAQPDTAITIAAAKAAATTQPAVKSQNDSRRLILGGAGVAALVAVLGFAAWRRGRDVRDD